MKAWVSWVGLAAVVTTLCAGCGKDCEKACTNRQMLRCDHVLSFKSLDPAHAAAIEKACEAPFEAKCVTKCNDSWREEDVACVTKGATWDELEACEKARKEAAK
ncbi:MAG: hypothetical protein JRI68_22805 [Deltaproteobacteria bacterium]|nr:hypothetical protein [Deltaproteobacteria bacterium]